MSGVFLKKIGQSGEASWWRVWYQRGLPRLVKISLYSKWSQRDLNSGQPIECYKDIPHTSSFVLNSIIGLKVTAMLIGKSQEG